MDRPQSQYVPRAIKKGFHGSDAICIGQHTARNGTTLSELMDRRRYLAWMLYNRQFSSASLAALTLSRLQRLGYELEEILAAALEFAA